MKKITLTLLAAALCCTAFAQQGEHALWIRKASISPDGTKIAFSYQGDIFTVSSEGGKAEQITSDPAYESDPLWTSDGKTIVFSSTRELSKDIWKTPCDGGVPVRLTTWGGAETPLFVSPDGFVYYSASIQSDARYGGFPGDPQLYKVPLSGGRSTLVCSLPVSNLSIAPDGTVIYEDYKGYEDPLRKHHRSSVTRDIWRYSNESFTKLSTFDGEDRNPVFSSDGKHYYYLSEEGGNFNVWKASTDGETPVQITSLPTHPVRFLSISSGDCLAFSYNGELYTCVPGEEPRKVSVTIIKDKTDRDKVERNISSGITALDPSPNGKEIAVVAHGDVYVIAPDQKTTRRITDTPSQERNVSFSSDGRTLYYAAERDGCWSIYKSELTRKEDKYFAFSYDLKESRFSPEGQTCFQPQASPDGKWVAYLRDRSELVIQSAKGDKQKSLLSGVNYSYSDGDLEFEWSPDGKSILTTWQADGGWNNSDIALIDIESGAVTNLTRSGYSDGNFQWALGGRAMTFTSDKNGYRSHGSWGAEDDIYAMFFDGKAYRDFTRDKTEESIAKLLETPKEQKAEKKDSLKAEKKGVELDLENRDDRTVRLTSRSGRLGSYYLTQDGKSLYFSRQGDKGADLCKIDTKSGDVRTIAPGAGGSIVPSRDGKTLYIVSVSGIGKMGVGADKSERVTFSSRYDYQSAKEREYIFYHAWKQVSEKFYDKSLHGVDWTAMRDNYSHFLPYITNNYDFQDLLSEMLGELNASHTGARYRSGVSRSVTAGCLGVIFDENWRGKGLRIAEVLPGSPLAIEDPEIAAGDVILAVNGEEIAENTPWYDVLKGHSRERILVKVKKHKGEAEFFVETLSSDSPLLYKRWVRSREKMVEELSGGRIGYVHVQGMNSPSFREVYSKALGKYRGCEALIVDTRHNGGGWLHDDLASFLGGKAYIEFRPRGQYIGTEPYSKWNKPSCVLVGEDNYSDACGFPYVYKTLGIGKLIGAPVPGTMTAVWWETQIDNTLVFGIPQVTSWGLAEGRPLENLQIDPDILVYNTPEDELSGRDRQLEEAVKELLKECDEKQ